MNELCKNCGKTIDKHFPYVMDGKIALNYCFRNGKKVFTPSGLVSVPVEFVEAAKGLIGEHDLFPNSIETNQAKEKLRSMLTEIEKGGGG